MALGETIHTLLNQVLSKNFPLRAPQTVHAPYILFAELDKDPTIVKDHTSPNDVAYWQVSIFNTTYASAKTMEESVRTVLDGYTDSECKIIFDTSSDIYEDDSELYHIAHIYKVRTIRTN